MIPPANAWGLTGSIACGLEYGLKSSVMGIDLADTQIDHSIGELK
jgi:hypothetical protein